MIDLSKIEDYRENNRIEAKKALGGLPQSIWETYSSFANTLGGILLLGVEEHKDKTLHPVDLPDPEKLVREFYEILNDSARVSVNVLQEKSVRVERVEGKRIVVIEVPRAARTDRPVYVGGNPFNGTYRRGGEGDYRCTRAQVEAMLRDAEVKSQDMQIAEEFDVSALDFSCIGDYRSAVRHAGGSRAWLTSGDGEFLHKLGAIGYAADGAVHPTVAGLLMFGRLIDIRKRFPEYYLCYREEISHKGETSFCVCSDNGLKSGNLLEFFFAVINKISEEFDDKEVVSALSEALENALVNADYYGSKGVVVVRKKYGFVFSNPGGFRLDVKEAETGGISDPRNLALIKIFSLMGFGRASGDGLPSIFAIWKKRGWERPLLRESFAPERTTLTLLMRNSAYKKRASRPVTAAGGTLARRAVINYLTDKISGDAEEISSALGLKVADVRSLLSDLLKSNIVVLCKDGKSYSLKS